ncbi:TPA: regulator, partial [Enterobacter hormaechei]|nr:regulator [Enterobacter hormaechei]
GKSRLFTRRAIEQSQEGRRQECIERAARRRRLIAQGLYIDEMESVL